jgi:hypothetical protein
MKYYLSLLLLLAMFCCKDDSNCLKSTGKIITESRNLPPFNVIFVHDNLDLIFTSDTVQKVEIEAGKNIMDGISTEVINGSLYIKNNNKCNWARSYDKKIKVYISQPSFFELYNYTSGNISNSKQQVFDSLIIHNYGNGELNMNIKCDKLKVDTNFFGDIILSGEAGEVQAHCFRLARLDTRSLKCQDFSILYEAEGDSYIYAENNLSGKIKSAGNVYYYGNPVTTNLIVEGNGKFVKGE